MRRLLSALIMATLPLLAQVDHRPSDRQILLVSSQDTRQSFYGRWLNLIYTEAFRRLGLGFRYEGYPGARARLLAESGQVDGEIHRPISYTQITRSMMQVGEPSFTFRFIAYTTKPGISLKGWESLRHTEYTVDYRRGTQTSGAALMNVVSPARLSDVATTEQGLRKLLAGHSDIYIDQEAVVAETLARMPGPEAARIHTAGVMASLESHVYLNRRHAELIPRLVKVLKTMKREGLIEHYRAQAAKPREERSPSRRPIHGGLTSP
nr:hypothetical protein [uncultured Holophaga sp.]